ncbi:hypothetical protein [Muricoccus radiodurans]|uniref:hypothetical protein n=1 Tax=Muricoccus radiodurans TaxID=2231721 RepID=UPI003CEB84D8
MHGSDRLLKRHQLGERRQSGCACGGLAGTTFLQTNAAEDAADAQRRAAAQGAAAVTDSNAAALTQLQSMYNQGRTDLAPFRDIGPSTLANLVNAVGASYQQSPGYAFAQDEGRRAVEQSAAARGGFRSGATLAALQDRAQGIAAQDYGNWYSRLAGLGTMAQNSAAGSASAAQNFGNTSASLLNGQGCPLATLFGNAGNAGAMQSVATANA